MDVTLLFPYKSTNEVMKLLDEVEIKIGSQAFDNDCKIVGSIPVQNANLLNTKVELLNKLGVKLTLVT